MGDAVLRRMSRGLPGLLAVQRTWRKRAAGLSSEILSPVRGESCASHLRPAQTGTREKPPQVQFKTNA